MSADLMEQPNKIETAESESYPWPERPELIDHIKKKRPLHTGKIRGKDSYLCRSVALDLIAGQLSKRQICAKHEIGFETMTAIMALMEQRGELRTLDQTTRDGLGNCIALMVLQLQGALMRGEFSTAQMPIALCALIDKKGQLEAGIVPGTQRTEAEAWESKVDVAWRALRRAKEMANAVPSERQIQESDGVPTSAIDVDSEAMPGGGGGLSAAHFSQTRNGDPSEKPGTKRPS